MVIKKYKRPTLCNCFIYTFFRKNKALRSYQYAQRLLDMGVSTPKPIAYITIPKLGFFHTGYYISEYLPHKTIKEAYSDSLMKNIYWKNIFEYAFIAFVEDLYSLKIFHKDFNSGNVLVTKIEDKFHFSLVDINRITFDKDISLKTAIKGVSNLGLSLDNKIKVLKHVYLKREISIDKSLCYILLNRFQKKTQQNIKYRAKRLLSSIKTVYSNSKE